MKMQLMFESWRKYLSEADYSQELGGAHDDGDVDMFDEWMVWARDRVQYTVNFVAAQHLDPRPLEKLPGIFKALSPSLQQTGLARAFKRGIEGDLYNGLDPKADPPVPESLTKEVLDSLYGGTWPPANEDESEDVFVVLKPLVRQIMKELTDFGKVLEKIWADPEGAQFKEKLVKRTIEDWRAAKALAESIV